MANKIIVNYLSENLKKGYPPAQLRKKLLAAGYPQSEVDEALRILAAATAKPMPKPAAKPAPQKPMPKPAAKPAPQKPMPKPAAKPAPQKPMPKPAAKPVPKPLAKQTGAKAANKPGRLNLGFLSKLRGKKGAEKARPAEKITNVTKGKAPSAPSRNMQPGTAGASRNRKTINPGTILIVAVIITIVEVGAFLALIHMGYFDLSPAEYCIEDWGCASWNPRNCPPNSTQTRSCVDSNDCGTTEYRPAIEQSCVPIKGGLYVFVEHDFISSGLSVADFDHYTRDMEANGTAYKSYVTVVTSESGSVIRSSVMSGDIVALVFDENEQVMTGMGINPTTSSEYGTRSTRYDISDLGTGTLLIEADGWFVGFDYESADKAVVDNLAGIFVQKVTLGGCEESWDCGDWSVCTNGSQTRVCAEASGCGTVTAKPAEWQACQDYQTDDITNTTDQTTNQSGQDNQTYIDV